MRKLIILFLLANIFFSSSVLSFAIPDGSEGSYYGDIYKDPAYNYLNKDLNEIINSVLEGIAAVTPPEEGVSVFPYDPVLYYLLIRGFGLDASMQQKVMQYLNKSFLENKKSEIYKELGKRYDDYEYVSYLKSVSNVNDLRDANNLTIARNILLSAGQKKTVIDFCNQELSRIFTCRDEDFDQTFNSFVREVSGLFQLGTYCGIKYEEINSCESQNYQTSLSLAPQKKSLILSLLGSFTGKIITAQMANETTTEVELPSAITVIDRSNYLMKDLGYSLFTLPKIYYDLGIKAFNSAPIFKMGDYVEITKCIKDDDDKIYPYEIRSLNIQVKNPQTDKGGIISLSDEGINGNINFSYQVTKNFFNDINIFDFKNPSDLYEYINNQCISLKVKLGDENPTKTSPYTDCMISNLRAFVDANNKAVKILKDLKSRIDIYLGVWKNIIGATNDLRIDGNLKDKMSELYGVYINKGERVDELVTIKMPTNFSKCSDFRGCSIFQKTIKELTDNFERFKEIFTSSVGVHPYSELAVFHYTYSYFKIANDIKKNCIDGDNIVNKKTYGSYLNKKSQYANIRKIKLTKKIEVKKSFKNFFEALYDSALSIFKPKEFTINIEK